MVELNRILAATVVGALLFGACGDDTGLSLGGGAPYSDGDSLPLGDVDDLRADDATWGNALECKSWPNVAELPNPEITISLRGLTLRLRDRTTGFDKVYAIGPGTIEPNGESKSYYPVRATGKSAFKVVNVETCKKWWTDPDTGKKSPVFAGMPFIRWYGGYGIHGPIDNFRDASGGTLRRGYVSHGCVRMEAADVLEVAARIGGRDGRSGATIKFLTDIERAPDGTAIDVAPKWIGSECRADSDCGYAGAKCLATASGRGSCSAACDRYCTYDKYGYSPTYCVENPTTREGVCAIRPSGFNNSCKRFDGLKSTRLKRHKTTTLVDVCSPS